MFSSASSETDILLENVQCRSTDQTLLSCPHNGVGVHNCSHAQDVMIYCDINGNNAHTYIHTCTKGGGGGGGGPPIIHTLRYTVDIYAALY